MYDFWYNHIKKDYGDNVKLIYTDTDSLIIEFTATEAIPDIYEHINKRRDLYDFSEYSEKHFCYDTSNAKVVGKFKDESLGRPISEVVAISSKMYAYTRDSLPCDKEKVYEEAKKAKGVSRAVVKTDLNFKTYKKCLLDQQVFENTQAVIRSKNHKIGVYHQLKTSLSPIDTKRYIRDDGINTYAFGHYRIGEEELVKMLF